jgi:hypothetical protein
MFAGDGDGALLGDSVNVQNGACSLKIACIFAKDSKF